MNGADERPVLQLLVCFAEILQGLAVEKLHLAHWPHRRHESGNAIDDLPPGEFSRTQGFLAPLAILDVHVGSVPFEDVARFIPQWIGAKQEPSIGTVESANASFRVDRSARSQSTIATPRQVSYGRPDESRLPTPSPALVRLSCRRNQATLD